MRYFANTSWALYERIIKTLVNLVVGIWVARYLGPENFGLLSYAQSFVFLFLVFATLGLDGVVVRDLVKGTADKDVLLGTAFVLKLIGALLILPLVFIGLMFTSNDSNVNMMAYIIAFSMIFQSFHVIDFYYQANVRLKYVAIANFVVLIVSTIFKIALILGEASLIWFAVVSVIDVLVLSIALVYLYIVNSRQKILRWRFDWALAKSLLFECWPLILSGCFLMIQTRIDQVMLNEMIGAAVVGQYSVALRLVEAFVFVAGLLKVSLSPAVFKAKEVSDSEYYFRLENYYRLSFALFLLIALPLYFISSDLVIVLFGDAYAAAGGLLALMSIRLVFSNMGLARGVFIVADGLFKFSLLTMMVGTICNIILNVYLIEKYQAEGAIIATMISFVVTIFVIDIFYSKTRYNCLLMIKAMLTFWKMRVR